MTLDLPARTRPVYSSLDPKAQPTAPAAPVGPAVPVAPAVQGVLEERAALAAQGLSALAIERLDLLRDLPLFRSIVLEQLLPLAEASQTMHYQPGEYIVRQDEPGDSIYMISEGRVEVLARIVHDGIATESAVASLAEGDALGELSVLDGQPRSASCVAVVPTTCVRLDRETLRAAMMRYWPLAEALMGTLAARLRHADKVMAEHASDPLTGVYNRRALYELYDREARRAQRAARRVAHLSHNQIVELETAHAGDSSEDPEVSARRGGSRSASGEVQPMAVLFIDVNKFKTINDTYGHQTGDEVLIAVARTLSECGRATDHVARYGGDEFVVILPEAGETGAALVSDRVKHKLADEPPGPVPFSISIGAAVVDPMEPPTLDDLMHRADEEMYRDKARQR